MREPEGELAGAIGGRGRQYHMSKNNYSQYFDLQVNLPGIVISHKFEIFHNHGGIYRFERKFNKNYGER